MYKAIQSHKELLIKGTLLIPFPFLITAYLAYLELLHWIQTWIYKHFFPMHIDFQIKNTPGLASSYFVCGEILSAWHKCQNDIRH